IVHLYSVCLHLTETKPDCLCRGRLDSVSVESNSASAETSRAKEVRDDYRKESACRGSADLDSEQLIHIAPEDQHKKTFTCLFGTFAYTRMSFGLCNAPSTFQRCMLNIFSDLLEECMEVFMDDFMVYVDTFDACLENLSEY
ncbi:Retrovirus-related Pol polyprotein from transposon 17.6, partial [Mucuna pruriens]